MGAPRSLSPSAYYSCRTLCQIVKGHNFSSRRLASDVDVLGCSPTGMAVRAGPSGLQDRDQRGSTDYARNEAGRRRCPKHGRDVEVANCRLG